MSKVFVFKDGDRFQVESMHLYPAPFKRTVKLVAFPTITVERVKGDYIDLDLGNRCNSSLNDVEARDLIAALQGAIEYDNV